MIQYVLKQPSTYRSPDGREDWRYDHTWWTSFVEAVQANCGLTLRLTSEQSGIENRAFYEGKTHTAIILPSLQGMRLDTTLYIHNEREPGIEPSEFTPVRLLRVPVGVSRAEPPAVTGQLWSATHGRDLAKLIQASA